MRGACSSGTCTTEHSSASSRSPSHSASRRRARRPTRPRRRRSSGARAELAAALEELRELARGIHPAVLTDRGLAACDRGARRPHAAAGDRDDAGRTAPRPDRGGGLLRRLGGAHEHRQVRRRDGDRGHVETGDERVTVTVTDDGCGGADPPRGTGSAGCATASRLSTGRSSSRARRTGERGSPPRSRSRPGE